MKEKCLQSLQYILLFVNSLDKYILFVLLFLIVQSKIKKAMIDTNREFYPSPKGLLKPVIEKRLLSKSDIILEPCNGNGDLSNYLINQICFQRLSPSQEVEDSDAFQSPRDNFSAHQPKSPRALLL